MKIIKYTSLLSVLFFLSATQLANAQNGVAIAAATATADGSAMLDVQSTSKGFLVPRMSTTNRTNISSPATGLLVYDNTVGGFFYWTGSAWVEISAGALSGSGTVGYDAAWSTTSALGNSNVFNNGTSVGIGSTIPNYKLDVAGSIGIANNNNTATNKLYLSSGDANHYIYSTGTSGNSMFFGEFGGVFNFYNTNSATTQVSFNAGAVSATGAINSGVGYTVGGLAGTGSYLRGNGTDFVSSAIQAGDIPSGSGNYVQNTTTQQASSNFNISGAGTMAGALSVGGAATVTGLVTANAGLKTSGSYYTLYGGNCQILANGDNHTGGGIAVSDDGGFYDFNDGYVTYLGSTGLRIAGNNGTTTSGNLQVVGLAGTGYRPVWTDASGNLTNGASNGNGRVWGSNGTQSAQQSTGTVSAYVSYRHHERCFRRTD